MAPEDNFKELTNLTVVPAADGQPVMSSGNFAVVFKMQDKETGKLYALKCFTKEQEGREDAYHQIADELKNVDSPYLVPLRYLDKELFVDTDQTDETEFPVLLMDWVEGKTLDKYLRENLDDKYALEMLAYRFSQLAQWLIPQPFAHGDLKPDNILVREDSTLVLVDYDGMYVPAMKGQKARELGSPDFRHPLRTENDFDEHIDDFPLVSILLSLKAISIAPSCFSDHAIKEGLLFSEKDYKDINNCSKINSIFSLENNYIRRLLRMFLLCISSKNKDYNLVLSNFFYDKENEKTKRREDYLEDCYYTDDWEHSIYDKNKEKLIRVKNSATVWYGDYHQEELSYWYGEYNVKPTTKVICDKCFRNTQEEICEIAHIRLPNSVELIGDRAFEGSIISYIELPSPSIEISASAFFECNLLETIIIPPGYFFKFAMMLPYDIQKLKEVDTAKAKKKIRNLLNEARDVLGCSNYDILNYLFGENGKLHNLLAIVSFYFRGYDEKRIELDYSSKRWSEVFWDEGGLEITTYHYSHRFFINDLDDDGIVTDAIFYVIIDMGGLYLIENKCLFAILRYYMMSESVKYILKNAYVKTAEQRIEEMRNFLGECYMSDNSISKEKAIDMFDTAAKKGNPKAQYNLGYCYENGIGTISDRLKARYWYEKASERGHLAAKKALERFDDLPF